MRGMDGASSGANTRRRCIYGATLTDGVIKSSRAQDMAKSASCLKTLIQLAGVAKKEGGGV